MKLYALPIALLLAVACLNVQAERTPSRPQALVGESARVIVKFRDGSSVLRAYALSAAATPAQQALSLAARAGALGQRHGVALHTLGAVAERVQVVRADGLSASALATRLAADPEVEYAQPDRRMHRVAVPNDPLFASGGAQGPAVGQWYLRAPAGEAVSAINAVGAWGLHTGSPSVVVAVLDTGVRTNHPDLAGKLLTGYDMISDATVANDGSGRDSDPSDPGDWVTQGEINANPSLYDGCEVSDSSWHGTQVAGIVAAATGNAVGIAGSGGHVMLLPVRVLGKCFGYTSDIVAGMRWAAGIPIDGVPNNPTPAKVINLSLGSGGACSQLEADAVAEVVARGAVVVAAAGNSAGRAAGSPANCPGAIGVAALRHAGSKVGFSDLGPEIAIAAPGGNCVNIGADEPCLYPILTTTNSGAQGPAASIYSDSFNASVGTSFSSPLVAGTAALLYSVKAAITPAQVRAALQASARPFPSSGLPPDPQTGPIPTCQPPGAVDQLQCYCTTSTCGSGMLDADDAVKAVLGSSGMLVPVAALEGGVSPQAAMPASVGSGGSLVPAGRTIVARRWTLIHGGGAIAALAGPTDGETIEFTPSAAGTVTLQLALTDDRGLTTASDLSFTVAAAAASGSSSGGGGGGGGSTSPAWLLALACAAWQLRRRD
jgi:serine protease